MCRTQQNQQISSYLIISFLQSIVEMPKPYDRMLTVVRGQKWKDIRNTLTPTFSASKMKQASESIIGPLQDRVT